MTCQEIREQELIEAYVAGSLSGETLEAVEAHYFGCDDCARFLHECRLTQTALRERAAEIRAESLHTGRAWPRWLPALALAASVLVAALLFWPQIRQAVKPGGVDYAQLAKVDPPGYEPMQLRGSEDRSSAPFQDAMRYYVRGEYGLAVGALRKVAAADPEVAEPRFYLAASELLSGHSREAIDSLTEVVRLGDRRFVERSRFLLAKAWLQQGRPDAAQRELLVIADGQGELATAARQLLAHMNGSEPKNLE